MGWGESPRWYDGALWLSDTQRARLWTDASGEWRPFALESPSNGLWFLPDGRLVGALMRERRIGEWDGRAWRPYADLAGLGAGPLGDMIGDADGNLYVDDVAFDAAAGEEPVPGRIILVRPDGSAVVAAEDVEFPNGLALVDGGATLVVAQTAARCLTAFEVLADGTLGERRRYADLAGLVGPDARPDGIWPAKRGVWVATTSGRAIVRVGEDEVHETVPTAPLLPIACCLRDDGALIATLADTRGAPLLDAVRSRRVTASAVLIEPRKPLERHHEVKE
ncbi:SMP-30/gluconolactonase/LRE family protein [Actinomadura sp. RB99]|jgi:sugar lactone lactonase YvrE|uniref:SMP-30/gluconolactonase/LRE family protein n=1 Tax=Actinomadura sp. RB99 TaxID=2691577 RepID=UPI001688B868|nr:SMP-30/gluconolactonase/LRE family protein [Actinomadura sp. RB99]